MSYFSFLSGVIISVPLVGLLQSMVSAQSIPAKFQGKWVQDLGNCNLPVDDSKLVISEKLLEFHESEGKVISTRVAGNLDLYGVADFSGEGQTWRDSFHLRLSKNQMALTTIYDDGSSFTRYRCK